MYLDRLLERNVDLRRAAAPRRACSGRLGQERDVSTQVVHERCHRAAVAQAAVTLRVRAEVHDPGKRLLLRMPKVSKHSDATAGRVVYQVPSPPPRSHPPLQILPFPEQEPPLLGVREERLEPLRRIRRVVEDTAVRIEVVSTPQAHELLLSLPAVDMAPRDQGNGSAEGTGDHQRKAKHRG